MIVRGAMRHDAFLRTVGRYVTGGEACDVPRVGADGIAYLGAGYWRAVLWLNPECRLFDGPVSDLHGVTLMNPDYTREQTMLVEQLVALLARLEYNG